MRYSRSALSFFKPALNAWFALKEKKIPWPNYQKEEWSRNFGSGHSSLSFCEIRDRWVLSVLWEILSYIPANAGRVLEEDREGKERKLFGQGRIYTFCDKNSIKSANINFQQLSFLACVFPFSDFTLRVNLKLLGNGSRFRGHLACLWSRNTQCI